MTDDLGRRFAYEYDRSGGEAVLTRVTSDGKDVAYAYHDKDATAASLALSRVAVPGLPALDIEWNGAGQVVSTTVGDRFTTEYVREDDVCRKIELGGAVTVYRTNPFGRIVSVTNPEGHTMRQIYDEDGAFLNQIVTPSGARTGFSYTPWGGLYEKTLPGGGKEQFRYDDHGNLTQVTDADGKVRRFSYNACGQMTFTASADGVAKYVTYDAENGDCLSCLHYGDKTAIAACPAVAVTVIVVSMACSATSMIADRWTSDEFPTASVVGGVSSIALSVLPGVGAVRGGLELAVFATSYSVSVYSANEACKASRQARLREGRR